MTSRTSTYELSRHDKKVVSRLTGRALRAHDEGADRWHVRGGRFDVFGTAHSEAIYAEVDARLALDGLSIAVVRDTFRSYAPTTGEVSGITPTVDSADTMFIYKLGESAVLPGINNPNVLRHEQVYPPAEKSQPAPAAAA